METEKWLEFPAEVRGGGFTGIVGDVGKNGWSIDVHDPSSGIHILTLTFTFEQFGALLANRPQDGVLCRMTPLPWLVERLGKRRDHVTVIVDLPKMVAGIRLAASDLAPVNLNDTPIVRAMVADGWEPQGIDHGDRWTHSRRVPPDESPRGVDGYEVSFVRYIHPSADPPPESEKRVPSKAMKRLRRKSR